MYRKVVAAFIYWPVCSSWPVLMAPLYDKNVNLWQRELSVTGTGILHVNTNEFCKTGRLKSVGSVNIIFY